MKKYISFFILLSFVLGGHMYAGQPASVSPKSWFNAIALTGIAGIGLAAGAYELYGIDRLESERLNLARLEQNLYDIEASLKNPYRICAAARQRLGMKQRPSLKKVVFATPEVLQEYRPYFGLRGFPQVSDAFLQALAVSESDKKESLEFFTDDARENVRNLKDISSQDEYELAGNLMQLNVAAGLSYSERENCAQTCNFLVKDLQVRVERLKIQKENQQADNRKRLIKKAWTVAGISGLLTAAYFGFKSINKN